MNDGLKREWKQFPEKLYNKSWTILPLFYKKLTYVKWVYIFPSPLKFLQTLNKETDACVPFCISRKYQA